jgi:hypothetical protein
VQVILQEVADHATPLQQAGVKLQTPGAVPGITQQKQPEIQQQIRVINTKVLIYLQVRKHLKVLLRQPMFLIEV